MGLSVTRILVVEPEDEDGGKGYRRVENVESGRFVESSRADNTHERATGRYPPI